MDRCVLPKAGSCMKHGVWIIALLVLLGPAGVEAQVVADCGVLEERLERQDSIRGFLRVCDAQPGPLEAPRRTLAVRRCQLGRPGTSARPRRAAGRGVGALRRSPDRRPRCQGSAATGLQARQQKSERPGAAQDRGNTSGPAHQRISWPRGHELGSPPIGAASDKPRARDREFRSGLVWSYAGPDYGHALRAMARAERSAYKWDDNLPVHGARRWFSVVVSWADPGAWTEVHSGAREIRSA